MPEEKVQENIEEYKELIIVRPAGEVSLKGNAAQQHLMVLLKKNIDKAFAYSKIEADTKITFKRIFVTTNDADDALNIISGIFGIGSYSKVGVTVPADEFDPIIDAGVKYFSELVRGKTYAVRTKKFGKFIHSRQSVNMALGGALNGIGSVDLSNPDFTVRIEILGNQAHLLAGKTTGAGGFPINPKNRAVVLMSGGFDSPVAAWQIMRRGIAIDYVFCNLAGAAYERSVLQVTQALYQKWSPGLKSRFHVVDYTDVVTELKDKVNDTYRQVILKRYMYKTAEAVAKISRSYGIITGEAIGQVSSQTLRNLAVIEMNTEMPVLRPLIGFDKQEIIDIARLIGTAKFSEKIKEYCSIAKGRPVVVGRKNKVFEAEENLDIENLNKVIDSRKIIQMEEVTQNDFSSDYLMTDTIPENAVVIDCQPKKMYQKWHFDKAINYPFDDVVYNLKELDKDKIHILYCAEGVQTPHLAEIMQTEGFEAYAYAGGMEKLK